MPTYTRPSVTIDDETIGEMRAVAAAFRSLEPTIAVLAQRLDRVKDEFSDQLEGHGLSDDDDFADFIDECGHTEMIVAAMDAVSHVTCAANGLPATSPEWFQAAEAERLAEEG